MIDRSKRDLLAQALRQLLSGRMDNLAFDDLDIPGGITDSDDRALFEVFYSVWPYYDDFRSHPMQLTDGQKLCFERCVLFLHSDCEFEWPKSRLGARLMRCLRSLFRARSAKSAGDMSVWPFYWRADYERALRSPRLLRGRVEPDAQANAGQPLGPHPAVTPSAAGPRR